MGREIHSMRVNFASRPAFQDRAMPFFVVHDTHQGLPAMGILFQFGQPAVDFAQGLSSR